MRNSCLCLLLISFAGVAVAQSKASLGTVDIAAQTNVGFRQLYFDSLVNNTDDAEKARAEKAELEFQRRVFYEKSKHFVDLWKKMTAQMNQQNTADVKLARKVAQAFHDLEKCEGWPARSDK